MLLWNHFVMDLCHQDQSGDWDWYHTTQIPKRPREGHIPSLCLITSTYNICTSFLSPNLSPNAWRTLLDEWRLCGDVLQGKYNSNSYLARERKLTNCIQLIYI